MMELLKQNGKDMVKKVKERYIWKKKLLSISSEEGFVFDNWYECVNIICNNCNFELKSLYYYFDKDKIKYCPRCGGFIDGIENPNPPIKEKNE